MKNEKSIEDVKREHFLKTLKECDGSRKMTAQILKVSLRSISSWINKYLEEGYEVTPVNPTDWGKTVWKKKKS